MPRKTPERQNLEEALANFRRWGFVTNGSKPFDRYERWVQEYPDWDELTRNLVDYLDSKEGQKWNKAEEDLAVEAVYADVFFEKIFRCISDEKLSQLVHSLCPIESVRHSLHTIVKLRESEGLKRELYIFIFENDPLSIFREYVLLSLARMQWSGTEEAALALWKEDDFSTKTRALECLAIVKSAHYSTLVEEALNSKDEHLVKSTQSLVRSLEIELGGPCGQPHCRSCNPQIE